MLRRGRSHVARPSVEPDGVDDAVWSALIASASATARRDVNSFRAAAGKLNEVNPVLLSSYTTLTLSKAVRRVIGVRLPDVHQVASLAADAWRYFGDITIFTEEQTKAHLVQVVKGVGAGPGLADTPKLVLSLYILGALMNRDNPEVDLASLRRPLAEAIAYLSVNKPERYSFLLESDPQAPSWLDS